MNQPREERTFVMLKPDGVQRGLIGECLKRFEQRGLKVVALEMFKPSYEQMHEHYPQDKEWIKRLGEKATKTYAEYGLDIERDFGTTDELEMGRQVRTWLIDYMTSAPLVRMVVEGVHAVDMVRKIIGPTLPYMADMGTLRGDYSIDSPAVSTPEKRAVMNLAHASETQEEAAHEIKHWFGDNPPVFEYDRI